MYVYYYWYVTLNSLISLTSLISKAISEKHDCMVSVKICSFKMNGRFVSFLSDLKNETIVSSCVTHILPSCGYFKGQEQICFNPTSWHLVTYNFLRGHKF